jgi:hypothetical protein
VDIIVWSAISGRAAMTDPAEKIAFDRQVLGVYLLGLESDLEAKLDELRRLSSTFRDLNDGNRPYTEQIPTVQTFAQDIDGLLVRNRVVRETLLQLRETAGMLVEGLRRTRPSDSPNA